MVSCARVGSPVGGAKDTLAPQLIGSNIDSARVNVPRDIKELRLDFDEYVTLNQVQKNLIISPPIKKIKKIIPSNLANKYVLIQWQDTLQANTTYNFNFANSIKDNNEGNVLPYFNFAFSTGETIDNLYISGLAKIIAVNEKHETTSSTAEKNIVIGLYKASDSLNYKEKPYYITVADPDGYFELNYLSEGYYRLIAFEDTNANSLFDSGKEKVAFQKQDIHLTKSISGENLNLYPSEKKLNYVETKENPGGLLMLFEGNPEKVEITPLENKIKDYKISHRKYSDSVYIWFNAQKENVGIDKSEQLKWSYTIPQKSDTVSIFYRNNAKEEMSLSNNNGNILSPKQPFRITSNFAIDSLQTQKWTLVSDSVEIPFKADISKNNPFEITVNADFNAGKKYALTVPKTTVSSFYHQNEKSYRFDFEADKTENYGSLTLTLLNPPTHPFWLQLLNEKGEVKYQIYTQSNVIKFDVLKPDTYSLRILVDKNENGHWEGADFEKGTFAEDLFDFTKKIAARPLWDLNETWDLTTNEESETGAEKLPENSEILKTETDSSKKE